MSIKLKIDFFSFTENLNKFFNSKGNYKVIRKFLFKLLIELL